MNLVRVNSKGIPEFDKKRDLIKFNVKETGESFMLPVIETVSDYKWMEDCLEDRLEHPEIYAKTEDVEAEIERIKNWLWEHRAEKQKEEPRYRRVDKVVLKKETWKEIQGFAGEYYVSDLGRIKNKYGEILKPRIQHNIAKVLLFLKNRCHQLDVCRIVADTFLIKPEDARWIEHIHGNFLNNSVDNLQWVATLPTFQKAAFF